MKKISYFSYPAAIGVILFVIIFTLIRKFYYHATPALQEYLFPVFLGSTLGAVIGYIRNINKELESTNQELQYKNKQIHDSLTYAGSIQLSLLPPAMSGQFFLFELADSISQLLFVSVFFS